MYLIFFLHTIKTYRSNREMIIIPDLEENLPSKVDASLGIIANIPKSLLNKLIGTFNNKSKEVLI